MNKLTRTTLAKQQEKIYSSPRASIACSAVFLWQWLRNKLRLKLNQKQAAAMLSVLERIRSLREEIEALKQENEIYKHQKGSLPESDRQRRRQRLEEIQAEIAAITDWKKL